MAERGAVVLVARAVSSCLINPLINSMLLGTCCCVLYHAISMDAILLDGYIDGVEKCQEKLRNYQLLKSAG